MAWVPLTHSKRMWDRMVGDLRKVQEAVRRLASPVDEAVEANRFCGMRAESAVLECLGHGSVATPVRKQAGYGRLESGAAQDGIPKAAVSSVGGRARRVTV